MTEQSTTRRLRLAVLISGGGTTLLNLLSRIEQDRLSAEVVLVISSRDGVRGLEYAREASVPTEVVTRKSCATAAEFSAAIFQRCRLANADLVVMAGFLAHVLIPDDFAGRVMNIHPSLIPAFCGKGFYGHHVHEAVLEYGTRVSGCTVHFVDNHYDHGPIILQRVVEVLDHDTPDQLAARVFEQECEAYPQAIQWCAEGRLKIVGRRVTIDL